MGRSLKKKSQYYSAVVAILQTNHFVTEAISGTAFPNESSSNSITFV
jgi:hypothetical protein